MARVIVILGLMIAITATMFAITQKSTVGEAANGPTTTVKLGDLQRPEANTPHTDEPTLDEEGHSLTSADPRPVTNPLGETTTAANSAQDVTNGPVAGAAPSIGTAGIDQKGRASFTGTATPGDTVSIVLDGKPVGSANTGADGNWEIEFKARAAKNDQELYASAHAQDGSVVIGPQRATIRPPATEGGLPRITIKSAEQVATTLQEGNVAPPEPKTGLVVEKIASGEPGMTVLSGKADPGATVRAAINGKASGDTRVAPDGTWTLIAPNLSGKEATRLRLQLLDASGTKLDESDLPFDVPATAPRIAIKEAIVAADFPSVLSSDPAKAKKGAKADPVVEDLAAMFHKQAKPAAERPKAKIVRVRRGDSLWRIAKRHLGKGRKWSAFYKANKKKIDNPDLIYPGQTLIIPG